MGLHSSFIGLGIRHAVTSLVSTLGGAYLSAWIIANLADKFGSTNNFDRSFSLVAYSYTPMCVAGILLLPVSYTHLDVYKRQECFNALFINSVAAR